MQVKSKKTKGKIKTKVKSQKPNAQRLTPDA